MHKHILSGCRPKPLSDYLKALGIFRILSEQKDAQAKAAWEGETFTITTNLNRDDFEYFFCEKYTPTPIVAPWNGGSGFYLGDATEGMDAILSSTDSRFKEYRNVILQIKQWPEIPQFSTVEDVQQTALSIIKNMKAGKKREDFEKSVSELKKIPPLKDGDRPDTSKITLREVEHLSKHDDNSERDDWKACWKRIKSIRTKCNTDIRNENKKRIIPLCRARLPEGSIQWLDAICALQTDGNLYFAL